MSKTTVFAFAAFTALLTAPLAFAHDEALGELAPACVVDKAAPFGMGQALARIVMLEADLDNIQENPAILDRSASGTFKGTVRFERTSAATTIPTRAVVTATFRFSVAQPETITAAHIHTGIPGANGSIVIPLNPAARFDVSPGTDGVIQTQFEVTDVPQITTLLNIASDPGTFYANVHSTAKPGGIIRGQVRNAVAVDAACLRSAVGAVGADVHELNHGLEAVGTQAATLLTSVQADLTALKTAAAALQADVAALKNTSGLAGLDANVKATLKLVVLLAAQNAVIGGQERDQILKALGF